MKTINIYDKKNRIQLINDVKNYFQTDNKSPFILKFYGAFFEKGSVNLIFEFMNRGTLLSKDYSYIETNC
jgi:serine/threonine protein kinase